MWFHFDEGDAAYAQAGWFNFDAYDSSESGTIELWRWVTPQDADKVRLTGKVPIPPTIRMGMYYEKSKDYALIVQSYYTGYKLIRGTITLSDAIEKWIEDVPDVEGWFLPPNLVSGVNFQVVQ
jgi:hypothetical protein